MVVVGKHLQHFACCGLVGNPHLTAKVIFFAPRFSQVPTENGFNRGFQVVRAFFLFLLWIARRGDET